MGKAPAFQFYPGDWRRDTQVQMASMETRGVWFEMLCCMWDSPDRGKLSGTSGQFLRLLKCEEDVFDRALKEIEALQIGDVTLCNGSICVTNRRMYNDHREKLKTREQTRNRVKKHREKQEKSSSNAKITPPSSSSTSTSTTTPPKRTLPNHPNTGPLFHFWNEQKIVTHQTVKKHQGHINYALKEYSLETIKEAIENYVKILDGKQYFLTYRWTLSEFLQRGLEKCLTKNDPFSSYSRDTDNQEGETMEQIKARRIREGKPV